MDPRVKQYFFDTVMKTKAAGSPRKRVCSEATAKIHWHSYRQFVGWATKTVPDMIVTEEVDVQPGVFKADTAGTLSNRDLLRADFRHLEEDPRVTTPILKIKRLES